MTSSLWRRALTVVVVTAVALLTASIIAAPALAALIPPPPPIATTQTNPGSGENDWWRAGWGNTLYPQYSLAKPVVTATYGEYPIGFIYRVDRSLMTVIDTHTPEAYDRSARWSGTNTEEILDMQGIFDDPPTGSWPYYGPIIPIEGRWYFHYVFFSNVDFATYQSDIGLGIDLTPPKGVTGAALTPVAGTTTWTSSRRTHVTWTPGTYDDMAGVGYYQVLVDGKQLIPDSEYEAGGTAPLQGRVYDFPNGVYANSVTVESMPPGRHLVSLQCVDRATNKGPVVDVGYFHSDPDTPTIEFTSPLGGLLTQQTLISVNASDLAGDPQVVFTLDGTTIATVTGPPYITKPDTALITAGTHVITATVTDRLGRSVTVSKILDGKPAVAGGFVPSDSELLNQGLTASTTTNPNLLDSVDSWWRQGWGNSLNPDLTVEAPSAVTTEGMIVGMLYTIDRTPTTAVDVQRPNNYYRAARGPGSHMTSTLDLLGVHSYPPTGGWPAPAANIALPYEGMWYWHFAYFSSEGYGGIRTYTARLGVDMTPPRKVENLVAAPNIDPATAGGWSASSRAHVTWAADSYDALSGVAYYQVYVDDVAVIPNSPTAPTQGRVYEIFGKTPSSITVEDMPPGRHKISIACVDRATNVGPKADTYFQADPDIPTVAITSPSAGVIGVRPTITVDAQDKGGVRSVQYFLDGVPIGTAWAAPFSYFPNLVGFAAGGHTLSATVTDMYGRTATAARFVTLDPAPLTLSRFSRTPELFFPIRRDKYKDNSTISYTVSKRSTATLTIRTSGGTTVRTLVANVNAGKNKFVWDGKWSSDGKAHKGKYTYQITATDVAANNAATGHLTTTIRDYELKKVGKNKVKVIKR